MDTYSDSFRFVAADTIGAGRSPEWPSDRRIGLSDEVRFLEPAFAAAGEPFALVGHSYGGAIALLAALADPSRISRIVVYEPALFSVLDQESPGQQAFNEIHQVASQAAEDVEAGETHRAARRFIDYWIGEGAWDSQPDKLKDPIASSMVNVGGWFDALGHNETQISEFNNLDTPVRYIVGDQSPDSSLGVARILIGALPNVDVVELAGLGHMGPITHPGLVAETVAEFL